jgi:hypothetical protein
VKEYCSNAALSLTSVNTALKELNSVISGVTFHVGIVKCSVKQIIIRPTFARTAAGTMRLKRVNCLTQGLQGKAFSQSVRMMACS